MNTSHLSVIMQRLGKAIERLPVDQIELLMQDKANIKILVTPRSIDSKNAEVFSELELSDLNSNLADAVSREDGVRFLSGLTKVQLIVFAKHCSVSVDNSIGKEKVIEKIVERKVGLRLRQGAFTDAMRVA